MNDMSKKLLDDLTMWSKDQHCSGKRRNSEVKMLQEQKKGQKEGVLMHDGYGELTDDGPKISQMLRSMHVGRSCNNLKGSKSWEVSILKIQNYNHKLHFIVAPWLEIIQEINKKMSDFVNDSLSRINPQYPVRVFLKFWSSNSIEMNLKTICEMPIIE